MGRSWPLLTGERGHYEFAAGRDPMPFIQTMEKFANRGGMLTEQLWDEDDLPNGRMKRGEPTGAAMPFVLGARRISDARAQPANRRVL